MHELGLHEISQGAAPEGLPETIAGLGCAKLHITNTITVFLDLYDC